MNSPILLYANSDYLDFAQGMHMKTTTINERQSNKFETTDWPSIR